MTRRAIIWWLAAAAATGGARAATQVLSTRQGGTGYAARDKAALQAYLGIGAGGTAAGLSVTGAPPLTWDAGNSRWDFNDATVIAGSLTADSFVGGGQDITDISPTALTGAGQVPVAAMGTGTPTANTVLLGSGAWGAVPAAAITVVNPSALTGTGTVPVAALPTTGVLPTSLTGAGAIPAAALPSIDATKIVDADKAVLLRAAGLTGVTLLGTTGAITGVTHTNSTFSGWGNDIGAWQNFNRVELAVVPWNPASIPTLARVRVRDTNASGTIWGDTVCVVPPVTLGKPSYIVADFGAVIANAANHAIWLEFEANAPSGRLNVVGTGRTTTYSAAANIASMTVATATGVSRLYAAVSLNATLSAAPTATGVPTTTFSNIQGAFTGWGSAVGVRQNFNRVELDLLPWNAPNIPTTAHLRIRETNSAGAILADATTTLPALAWNRPARIAWDLVSTVENAAGTPLWLEFETNGYTARRTIPLVYTSALGYPLSRYYTVAQPIATGGTEYTEGNIWAQFSLVDRSAIHVPSTVDYMAGLTAASAAYDVALTMPPVIYAVVGRETNLYFENCIRSQYPIEAFDIDCSTTLTGTTSQQEQYRWTYTPTGAQADATLTVTVSYRGAVVATGTSTVVSKAVAGATVSRKMLVIGDSTTAAKPWIGEVMNLCDNTGSTITLAPTGTVSETLNDADGASRTFLHEAISGKTVNYFYTDAASHFVSAGAFNFPAYLTANGLTMAAADWVVIDLGINDMFAATTDAACYSAIAAMEAQLEGMITSIQTGAARRVAICMTIPPSPSQDGFGVAYQNGQTQKRYTRNRHLLMEALVRDFGGRTANGVYVIPVGPGIDARNNFPTAAVAVNARNATTYAKQTNGVHPDTPAYWQIADAVYCCLRGAEADS